MPSSNTNAKLVDSKTIAAIFGVDPRRVQQLAKDGIKIGRASCRERV